MDRIRSSTQFRGLTDIIARVCEGNAHHPAGAQRYNLHFVARPCVPDDELAVQRTSHAMSRVASEMDAVHLIDVALKELLGGDAKLGGVRHVCTFLRDFAVGSLNLFTLK